LLGVSVGTITLTYSLGAGCVTTRPETVLLSPTPIVGTASICAGSSTTITELIGGGTWSSSNLSVATIASSGIVYGVSAGTSTISYTLPTGCATTLVVTVSAVPASIYGSSTVCTSASDTLRDVATGGIWSSSNTTVASIGATSGIMTGVTAGT